MKVPWGMPYIDKEELDEVVDSIKANWVTMGPKVSRLEKEIANYVGMKHGIGVNSGTAALDIALKALGIKPGDEVIVPAMTYIATPNAVMYQHAKPVLVDIDPKTYNLDPNKVREKITERTKAVMPIDYGGQSSDYSALEEIAREHNLFLVQDGAESLGAEYKGRKLCSFGQISTTSFHAAKLMTTAEGGMVFTNDDDLEKKCRIVRNQGEDKKYEHVMIGHNYRMTDLNAAIGIAQFKRLEDIIRKRAEIAENYTKGLEEVSELVTLPYTAPGNKHAWFFYPILLDNRDAIEKHLKENGIGTRVAWPFSIHHQPVYAELFKGETYPVAEKFAKGVLNLPMYYAMKKEEQEYVIKHLRDAIKKFAGKKYELGQ